MVRIHHILSGCALFALAAAAAAAAAGAQSPYAQPGYVNPFAQLSDADRLAQQLRIVAANPTDLYALLAAAKLSLQVGDTDAAAALYTRADRLNPQHPQVKAGMARLLVQAGRPGEALRRFADAQALGATLADFGADRALAYDLVGEQPRAQREYRALLRLGGDDETTRRYALSLGISGLKEPALALLEPLNRRGDRGAWRARAFVLAMTGDRAGAEKIAKTMMPPGMGEELDPFFDRLPRLDARGQAFAVNFGETRASPSRLADARLVPSLPALSPEPDPFPKVRQPVQTVARDDSDSSRKKRQGKKDRIEPVRLAAQPYVAPLPPPPAPTASQLASLNAVRMAPGSFMPVPSSRGVRVLPPPPEAYRGPALQVAAVNPAEADDEPDFAVAAVSALTGAKPAASPPASYLRPAPGAAQTFHGVPAATSPTVTLAQSQGSVPASPLRFTDVPSAGVSTFTLAAPPLTAPVEPVAAPGFSGAVVSGPPAPPPLTSPSPASAAVASPAATALAGVAADVPAVASTGDTGSPVAASSVDSTVAAPPPVQVAAITPATGAPPAPSGAQGDSVLAAIVAGINVTEPLPAAPKSVPAAPASGPSRLLANVEKKEEAGRVKPEPVKAEPVRADPVRAAASAPTDLPRRDARGRFLDAKGKPLLDARDRPLNAKAAAAWQLAQAEAKSPRKGETGVPDLLRKDARGRFVDAKGKPLLDARGRPLDAKAAAAWQLAQVEAKPESKVNLDLPRKDARGRFLDAKGKPLLDARGRPLDAKAAAAWKLADAKKKPEPAAKTEPQRYWVQVAGGANEATLGKEWAKVAAATPSLKGKQGWTTPLRATNRVLTGPFKSSAEAMAAVNQLKKEGLAAFMFTSDPGQKVARLGGK